MAPCIFCDIVTGRSPAHVVWEDGEHLAFLSIFPNTEGVTVVIPKTHHPSYIFDLPTEVLNKLIGATRTVAKILDTKLADVGRTGLIFEGFGVDHVHAKLIPMHGTRMSEWRPINSSERKFFPTYEGFISSHDGERASDADLARLAALLRS